MAPQLPAAKMTSAHAGAALRKRQSHVTTQLLIEAGEETAPAQRRESLGDGGLDGGGGAQRAPLQQRPHHHAAVAVVGEFVGVARYGSGCIAEVRGPLAGVVSRQRKRLSLLCVPSHHHLKRK
jgi:hypothetical protein